MKIWALAAMTWLTTISLASAATPASQPTTQPLELSEAAVIEKIDHTLLYRTGDVAVGSNLGTLHLGTAYRYLDAADAIKVVVNVWGNPPEQAKGIIGMIAPPTQSPLEADAWGIVITSVDDGHIDDKDAKDIDYDDMLKKMKSDVESENEARKKDGYDGMHLVGWAQAPRYDESAKKLIWAKEYSSDDANAAHSLNYDVRVLGRTQLISLNAVGRPSQLAELDGVMSDVAQRTEFVSGQRYDDYKHGSDKLAAYGVAGLIAGGIAAKAGLFKVLIVGLLALKKFLIIGVIAVVGFFKKIFGSKSASPASTPTATPATNASAASLSTSDSPPTP